MVKKNVIIAKHVAIRNIIAFSESQAVIPERTLWKSLCSKSLFWTFYNYAELNSLFAEVSFAWQLWTGIIPIKSTLHQIYTMELHLLRLLVEKNYVCQSWSALKWKCRDDSYLIQPAQVTDRLACGKDVPTCMWICGTYRLKIRS